MKPRIVITLALPVLVMVCACGGAPDADPPVVWTLDGLDALGGHPTEVLGSPRLVRTELGPAVEFDGLDDGLQLAALPLAGADELTVEILFRPYPDGPKEQRFLHLQEDGTKNRLLIELRTTRDGGWFLDTYIKSAGEGYTLYATRFEHETGPWYHAALVVDGSEMRHYVDGHMELSRPIVFEPLRGGHTSIGVRLNRVSWFKGAIHAVRFTPRALEPNQFDLLRR